MSKPLLWSKFVLLVLVCTSCAGGRAFTRGEYADPNVIEMLSDKFNENDLQLIAKKMVESLAASPQFQNLPTRPIVVVGKFKNSTSEHIDLKSLADKIQVQLVKTNKFAFQAKEAREEIAEEYEYQGSGYVKQGQAKGPGQQASADYILTGEISSIVQEVGADKSVYYKFTTKLNNLNTGILDWTDEKELRKKFEKQGVSW
ncbi:MAG: penicillin-binding protein activator LpoB [Myxococcaceae bacterium]|nr:penicillin-binding protein activator LpoB [Myxococcaceae bacterium]